VGPGVTGRAVGDRVAIAWLGYACGQCHYCITGWETLCQQQHNSGYSVDGAFAEYAVVSAAFATPVPDGITPLEAAPLTCAGVTTYKAVKVAGVSPAETVAVFGIGGLGHLALQYARIAGAFTVAVDVKEHKLAMAGELGADHLVNAAQSDPVEAIQALGGADVAIALAASAESFQQAYRSLRRGGRLVCVGLPSHGTLTHSDLRHRAGRHLGDRFDRRHPERPGRRLPVARRRPDPDRGGRTKARRGEPGDRRGAGR
jgi:propanol-preferring alcohol dehydrogenase